MSLKHFIKKVLRSSEVATIQFSIKPYWYSIDRHGNISEPWNILNLISKQLPMDRRPTNTYLSPLISIDKDRFQDVAHVLKKERLNKKRPNKKRIYLTDDGVPEGAGGEYKAQNDSFSFDKEIQKDEMELSATIVHEATHAICDMSSLGKIHFPLNESAAYLAETFYRRERLQNDLSTLRDPTDPLRFFANLLIESVGKPYIFSVHDCVPLMRAVLRSDGYASFDRFGVFLGDGLNIR